MKLVLQLLVRFRQIPDPLDPPYGPKKQGALAKCLSFGPLKLQLCDCSATTTFSHIGGCVVLAQTLIRLITFCQ